MRDSIWSEIVGESTSDFALARTRLLSWSMHRDAGVKVLDAPDAVAPGALARLRIRLLGVIRVDAPVEVIAVVDESDRAGFTYRALPGHPKRGDEEFLLDRVDDGRVRFTVNAWSAPALWWSRLGGPITRRMQHRVVHRYLAAALPRALRHPV